MIGFFGLAFAHLISSSSALAWDQHQAMIDRFLASPLAESRDYLSRAVSIPCQEEEFRYLESLATRIHIRAEAVPLLSKHSCRAKLRQNMTVSELLKSGLVDEPDLGMDQDLPEAADPEGYRKWMGGVRGPTSQGFRHMMFPGMEWFSPLQTFQLPVSRVGEAFKRIEVLGREADEAFRSGDLFWGLRITMWREHFLQDLFQPFHTTQVPSLRMVPWSSLFSGLVRRTTHAISNYHYAYEGMILEWMRSLSSDSEHCFLPSEIRPFTNEVEFSKTPRRSAGALGAALYSVLGDEMKSEEIDLPNGKGSLDYYLLLNAHQEESTPEGLSQLAPKERKAYMRSGEMVVAMRQVKKMTCELIREVSSGFWGDLDRALQGPATSNSSKTGK